MFIARALHQIVRSKLRVFSFFVTLLSLLQVNPLHAGAWGKTKEKEVFEGEKWNGIYFDSNKLYFTALIPNYSGVVLSNDEVSLSGEVKGEGKYLISSSINGKFLTPKSEKKFVEMIQKANRDFIVKAIHSSKLGAKYIVDVRSKKEQERSFWRFLATENRLIKMGTGDSNPNRRQKFFDSIKIK